MKRVDKFGTYCIYQIFLVLYELIQDQFDGLV